MPTDPDLKRQLEKAAELVAAEGRRQAAIFSRRIPASIKVDSDSKGVFIRAGGTQEARHAVAWEFGLKHMVFGDRNGPWFRTPHRPYMDVAREREADKAADIVADVFDIWARKRGFKPGP